MSIAEAIVDGDLCPLCACDYETCDCSPEAIKSSGGYLFVMNRANARLDRQKEWIKRIEATGARVEVKNSGHHWIITRADRRWDFWPSRQKFQGPESRYVHRGFERFLALIEKPQGP